MAKKQSRIQTENRERILEAALDVFARHGFRGASIDEIAVGAGMSKPNLFYYYKRKEDIRQALLERLLENWLEPLHALQADGEPTSEIVRYIRRKMEMAQQYPRESRLFASEISRGAADFYNSFSGDLKRLVDEKAELIEEWMRQGKLAKADPHHLIFAIWSTTQHYSDFDEQVRLLLGNDKNGPRRFDDATRTLETIFINGLLPR